jgi:hypothetical protein
MSEDRCPDCGATESCYACGTGGGWHSQKQLREMEILDMQAGAAESAEMAHDEQRPERNSDA